MTYSYTQIQYLTCPRRPSVAGVPCAKHKPAKSSIRAIKREMDFIGISNVPGSNTYAVRRF